MSGLRFHPHLTLQAAARIANQHGYELRVTWDGKQCVVTTVRIKLDDDFVPTFCRPMAG